MSCSMNPFDLLKTGDIETLRRTIEHDPGQAARRNSEGVSLLMMALYHRQKELADFIAERLPALDVFEAAALGKTEVLESQLPPDRAPNPLSPDGFTPLHLAAFFAQAATATWLLDKGADPDAQAENPSRVRPLHSAAAARSLVIVRELLQHGADPNVRQGGGWTPLHAACLHGLPELSRALIAGGADPAAAADDGREPRAMLAPGLDPVLFGFAVQG